LQCLVLDIDPVKKIADLSEKIVTAKNKGQEVKVGQTQKAIVELNKESHLVLSMKNNRRAIGVCIL
jgi:hypothetical protein